MIQFLAKKHFLLSILAAFFVFNACSKFDPILPEKRGNAIDDNSATAQQMLFDSPWITIQAGSHSLTNENESQIAASDIMGYINSITTLNESDPHYATIRQYVFDCFNVLQHLKFTLEANGSALLQALPGFEGAVKGSWQSRNDSILLSLEAIPTAASATIYTKQFAERFGGSTLQFQKIGATLELLIDGHFVCDPIVDYAYNAKMNSAPQLEAFSNVFAGFNIILAQSLSNAVAPPPTPVPPIAPTPQAVAYAWRIVRAGSKKDVTTEAGIIASANATMTPINTVYTHLEKGSSSYNALRDEVAKCYRLFGEMNITLYQDGTAAIDGPTGFSAKVVGTWKDHGNGEIAIQPLSVPLKKEANRFELRFANDFLTSPMVVKYNSRTGERSWHIHGPFVIEPCADYVKENGLKGYDGIMRFSKIFKGFDLHLANR